MFTETVDTTRSVEHPRRHLASVALGALLLTAAYAYEMPANPVRSGGSFVVSKSSTRALGSSLVFEPNVGQAPPTVRFLARTAAGTILLTQEGLTIVPAETTGQHAPRRARAVHFGLDRSETPGRSTSVRGPRDSITLQFVGAKANAELVPEQRLPGVVNYFLGSDSARWRTGIAAFSAVRYHELYPGIDVVFHGSVDGLEYDLELAPGANPSRIRIALSGPAVIRSDSMGEFHLEGSRTDIVQQHPHAFQCIGGREQRVAASFRQLGAREFGFELGHYEKSVLLTIDPMLVLSTYLGGTSGDRAGGVAVDRAGNIYVVGTTTSTNFPTAPATQRTTGTTDSDVFVAKLDASGSRLLYSTYLGGSSDDGTSLFQWSFAPCGPQIVVSDDGSVVLTGWTASIDFPTTLAAFQRAYAGGPVSAFVARLDPTGSQLTYSTYLGGTGGSSGNALALNSDGSVYVVGYAGAGFPEVNPVSEAKGSVASAFLTKLSPDGGSLAFSTRFGGSGSDWALSVAADASGKVWVAGSTASADFPTKNALQSKVRGIYQSCDLGDAFVSKFDTTIPALDYSTYLGGGDWDFATSVAVDPEGAAYVGGITGSTDFPIVGGFQPQFAAPGGCAGFLAKISPAGASLEFSSYVGGGYGCFSHISGCPLRNEGVAGLVVDTSGHVWMTGVTTSLVFPLVHPLQGSLQGFSDVFIAEVAPDGSSMLFSTYLGGTGADSGGGIALGADGAVIMSGTTSSTNFPVAGALFPNFGGGSSDAFIAKLSLQNVAFAATASADPTAGIAPLSVAFAGSAVGGTGLYTFEWDFGDGSSHSPLQDPAHTYALGGSYTAVLKVTDSAGATASAAAAISVAHNCSLACTASVPPVVAVGQAGSFSASATPSDCAGEVSYLWSFGDGATSTEASPSHTYVTPGPYAWSLQTSVGSVSCRQSGTITVAVAPVAAAYVVPAMAHIRGYFGTQWRAEVAVVNLLTSPAAAHLTLVFQCTDCPPLFATATVPAGGSVEWRDILVSLFGQPDAVNVSGALLVYADRPVAVTARSYDQTASGTLGSSYPALMVGDGMTVGQTGVLAGLKRNAAFRTNIGAVNLGGAPCTVVVTLYDSGGAQLGSPQAIDLGAGAWTQLNDVLAGAGVIDLAYATVVVQTPGGRAWAYASVVDNATGDPTTVPVVVP